MHSDVPAQKLEVIDYREIFKNDYASIRMETWGVSVYYYNGQHWYQAIIIHYVPNVSTSYLKYRIIRHDSKGKYLDFVKLSTTKVLCETGKELSNVPEQIFQDVDDYLDSMGLIDIWEENQ